MMYMPFQACRFSNFFCIFGAMTSNMLNKSENVANSWTFFKEKFSWKKTCLNILFGLKLQLLSQANKFNSLFLW